MRPDGKTCFAITLKRWFKANEWPQNVPEQLARALHNPTGPWGSQISHSMNEKHQPKPDFFVALGWFNEQVSMRNVQTVTDRRLRDRITKGQPLCHDSGIPFAAADFFQLYTGLIDPPSEFSSENNELTDEDAAEWTRIMRASFREISLKYMCTPVEAWHMLSQKLLDHAGVSEFSVAEDLQFVREVLCGLVDPNRDQLIRQMQRWQEKMPLQRVMEDLLEQKVQADRLRRKAVGSIPRPPFDASVRRLTDDEMVALTQEKQEN